MPTATASLRVVLCCQMHASAAGCTACASPQCGNDTVPPQSLIRHCALAACSHSCTLQPFWASLCMGYGNGSGAAAVPDVSVLPVSMLSPDCAAAVQRACLNLLQACSTPNVSLCMGHADRSGAAAAPALVSLPRAYAELRGAAALQVFNVHAGSCCWASVCMGHADGSDAAMAPELPVFPMFMLSSGALLLCIQHA